MASANEEQTIFVPTGSVSRIPKPCRGPDCHCLSLPGAEVPAPISADPGIALHRSRHCNGSLRPFFRLPHRYLGADKNAGRCLSHAACLFLACMIGGYSATGSLMGGGVGGAAQPIQIVSIAQLTTSENRTSVLSLFTFISGIFAALGALAARLFTVRDVFLAATLISLVGIATLAPLRLREYRGSIRRLSSK